jgi:hypothetical protein
VTNLDHIEALLVAWDEMDNAAQRISTSLPDKMSENVARLEKARLATREVVQRVSMALSSRQREGQT